MSDLTAAMGINAPSLYAAFGDKEQLFIVKKIMEDHGGRLSLADRPGGGAVVTLTFTLEVPQMQGPADAGGARGLQIASR